MLKFILLRFSPTILRITVLFFSNHKNPKLFFTFAGQKVFHAIVIDEKCTSLLGECAESKFLGSYSVPGFKVLIPVPGVAFD